LILGAKVAMGCLALFPGVKEGEKERLVHTVCACLYL